MEFERFGQIKALKTKGWTENEVCQQLQEGDSCCGGPTYMLAPDGRLHAVSCGTERVLHGAYPAQIDGAASVLQIEDGLVVPRQQL